MYQPWNRFLAQIAEDERLASWLNVLPQNLSEFLKSSEGQQFYKYQKLFVRLKELKTSIFDFNTEYVSFGEENKLTDGQKQMIFNTYKEMMPWRKGPFQLFGVKAQSEWLSFKKWDRLIENISPLKNRSILDVGCGNGYHMWRMLGEGASRVTGIDPCGLFLAQFELFKNILDDQIRDKINLLPLGIEQLPALNAFDTVFSMGVLYHRRSPIDHLYQLQNQLVKGGELVLETLVIDGDENTVLIPKDRYAQMPNIWYIPSVKALANLLERCGFVDIKLISVEMTTTEEQRQTELMTTQSLKDFLDPNDHTKTIEGYQAPTRAVFTAKRKS
jgi:tRNA (mo5U34)-methyltransferase